MNKMETQTPPQLTNLSPSSRRLNRRAFLGRMATGAALLHLAPGCWPIQKEKQKAIIAPPTKTD